MKVIRHLFSLSLILLLLIAHSGCANNSAFMEATGWDTSNYNPSTPVTANENSGWASAGYVGTRP